ncbi:splicing factor, arginine/serine-rich 19 [Platysternon megacephalum]|uniref:Splicing factor, arginine/serine-rich 19 n=1 Tax=Platysternon megacephalum TaxID=55544 RepID=A0A4D9DP14_9SAUR|nr:splicing factor, arginine/serine-rich 19 [Platysternon megacephalum]
MAVQSKGAHYKPNDHLPQGKGWHLTTTCPYYRAVDRAPVPASSAVSSVLHHRLLSGDQMGFSLGELEIPAGDGVTGTDWPGKHEFTGTGIQTCRHSAMWTHPK